MRNIKISGETIVVVCQGIGVAVGSAVVWMLWKQISIWTRFRKVGSTWQFMPGDSLLVNFPFGALFRPNFEGRKNSKKYGKIYHLQWLTEPVVILANKKLAAQFYRDNAKSVSRNSNLVIMGPVFEYFLGDAVGMLSGKKWQQCRALLRHDYSAKAVENAFCGLRDEIDKWSKKHLGDGSVLDFFGSEIARLPFHSFCRVLYGDLLNDQEERNHIYTLAIETSQLSGHSANNWVCNLPFFFMWPSQYRRRAIALQAEWTEFNRKKYEMLRLNKVSFENAGAFGGTVKRMFLKDGTDELPPFEDLDPKVRLQLVESQNENLLFNNDVTNAVLMTLLLSIAAEPEVQKELTNELRSAARVNDGIIDDYSFLHSFPYLEACLNESGRQKPFLTITAPERTADDIVLGNYEIPAGSAIAIDAETINLDPDVFPDPEKFDPTRFLDSNPPRMGLDFHRFGLNPRRECLGFRYAEAVIKYTTWNVLTKYDIRVVGGKEAIDVWRTTKKSFGIPLITPYLSFPKVELTKIN